jgi:hypothetical protein
VWHLKEIVTDESTSGTHADSTLNGNTGSQNNNDDGTGRIDGTQNFDGTGDYIQVPHNSSLNVTSEFTMEAWVYLANSSNNQKIVGKTPIGSGYLLAVQNGGLYPEIWNSQGTNYTFTSGSISSSQWTHLAVTWTTNGNMIGYTNGSQVNSISAGSYDIGTNSNVLRIGATPWNNPPTQFFVNGTIDELRISSTARSACWIETEYNNQSSPSTFYSISSQQTSYPTAVLLSSFSATEYEGRVLFQWKTGYEANNLGFNVYREEEDGPLTQINSELISGGAFLAGSNRPTAGHAYAWMDSERSAISHQQSAPPPLPSPLEGEG